MAMAPPPPGKPDDLWARICARPRPHKIVDYPVKDADGQPLGQIAIRILQQHEIELAAANAGQRARRALAAIVTDKRSEGVTGTALGNAIDSQAFTELYENIRATEIIAAACRDPKDLDKPAFPSADDVRKRLLADEIAVLMNNYATVQAELGPIVAYMSKEDYDAWISRLVVSGERFPLDSLTRELHQQLTFGLAQEVMELRARISAMDTSSPGSPPGSDTSSEPVGD